MAELQHSERDKEVAESAIRALQRVVPGEEYAFCAVLVNLKTQAMITFGNVDDDNERRMLEKASGSGSAGNFTVPEPH